MHTTAEFPVVVGLDRSPQAYAALDHAAALAERRRRPLRLVHAYEPLRVAIQSATGSNPDTADVLRKVAERLVADAVDIVQAFHPDVPLTTRIVTGSAAGALLEEALTAHTVVLGSRGTGGFAELLVGSTTMHVTAHAHCPVIAVPAPRDDEDTHRGVVVGVDGSSLSEPAIGYAFDAAADANEPLTALHAWYDVTRTGTGRMMPLGYDPGEVLEQERLALAESMAGWQEKFPEIEVRHRVVLGHPVRALVSASVEARLVVVGSRGRGAVRNIVLGSVSHGVLHHAKVPVAVVHEAH